MIDEGERDKMIIVFNGRNSIEEEKIGDLDNRPLNTA